MKAILIIFTLLTSTFQIIAQDIATARQQALNSTVTISGIITNGDELGPIRYIEDATAGIGLYDPDVMSGVNRGDSITVTGVLFDYNGLLELQPISDLTVHGSGYTVEPTIIFASQIGEDTEAELISIENAIFDNPGQVFSVGTHTFSANDEDGIIYVKADSELEGQTIPSCPATITAISSQYSFTGNDGYQLLIRDMNDFVYEQGICLLTPLVQTNVTTTSFDISWTTNLEGFSDLSYGLTADLELGTLVDSEGITSTDHSISLENLEAGSIYYVQGISYDNSDTTYSAITPFATISNSSGEIRVCFNHSVDTTVASIENAQVSGVYTNDSIKAYIDKAQHTLDVAVYNHSDGLITSAINDAYNRGVRVRYITCESTATLALGSLNDGIPVLERPEGMGIMHNKFIVVDANVFDSCWVLTGSTNWTSGQIFDDPNHLVMIQDQSVARTFEIEFNEMWGSDGDNPNASNAKFGANKKNNTPHHFTVNGQPFEVYFSPSDNTTTNIVNAIKTADYEIDFGLLVFTNNQLAWAIEDQYNLGVEVNGIIEQVNTQESEYEYLTELGANVLSHQEVDDIFHHKYCIIDHANVDSDPTVVTGSHNWSGAAETNNDENTIIIHDASITNQFYQEFHQRMNEIENAVEPSFNCVNEACVDPMDGSGTYNSLAACQLECTSTSINDITDLKYALYPNPNNGKFIFELYSNTSEINYCKIIDLQGRQLLTKSLNLTEGFNTFSFDYTLSKGVYFLEVEQEKIKVIVH